MSKNQSFSPNQFFLIIIICSALISVAIMFYSLSIFNMEFEEQSGLTLSPQVQRTALLGAVITYTEGAVEYKKPQGEWKRATGGIDLYKGYAVEVIGEGRAIISLDDGSVVRLNSDSSIILEDMDPNNIIINNSQGELYSRVIKSERIFMVKADDIIYESIGTAYKTINKEKEKGVEVYQCKVKVKKQNKEEVLVEEGKKYYVKNELKPEEENVVKEISKEEIEKDEFVVWNKEKDKKISEFKKEIEALEAEKKQEKEKQETPAVKETKKETEQTTEKYTEYGEIILSGKATDKGVSLSWSVSGLDVSNGYKLVKNISKNPVYPGDSFKYISDKEQKSYVWKISDGKTYYFRVCQYSGGKCGVYSNNIKLTVPKISSKTSKDSESKVPEISKVNSITLFSSGNGDVNWSVNGISSQGYKLVWSKTSGPTYPTRSSDKYKYFSSPDTISASINAFDGQGIYYVRVCEYLGGKCGIYSNEIEMEL